MGYKLESGLASLGLSKWDIDPDVFETLVDCAQAPPKTKEQLDREDQEQRQRNREAWEGRGQEPPAAEDSAFPLLQPVDSGVSTQRPQADRSGWVYFLLNPSTGLIKIGTSVNVDKRCRELGMAAGLELKLLGTLPGDQRLEKHLHERFATDRVHGEWFRNTAALSQVIQTIAEAPVPLSR